MDSLQNGDSTTLVYFSPTNEVSDQDFKDHVSADVRKERKSLGGRWREEVNVRQLEDGYNWRKYGMNYVWRANHPRSYYRCRHRHTEGCLATKQVQRREDDSSIFKVVYKGKHSCVVEQKKAKGKLNLLQHTCCLTQQQNSHLIDQVDFDACFFQVSDYLSTIQDSPATKM